MLNEIHPSDFGFGFGFGFGFDFGGESDHLFFPTISLLDSSPHTLAPLPPQPKKKRTERVNIIIRGWVGFVLWICLTSLLLVAAQKRGIIPGVR